MTPIHPFPLKARSQIRAWSDWPADVKPVLWAWNHWAKNQGDHTLSFYRTRTYKCSDCGAFCEGGYTVAFLDSKWFCDDCLIAIARQHLASGKGL